MDITPAFPSGILGSELSKEDQQIVLNCFGHRYTGTHKPEWVKRYAIAGEDYPVQFRDDQEWLENTRFSHRHGIFNKKSIDCYSVPTWPNGRKIRPTLSEIVSASTPSKYPQE